MGVPIRSGKALPLVNKVQFDLYRDIYYIIALLLLYKAAFTFFAVA